MYYTCVQINIIIKSSKYQVKNPFYMRFLYNYYLIIYIFLYIWYNCLIKKGLFWKRKFLLLLKRIVKGLYLLITALPSFRRILAFLWLQGISGSPRILSTKTLFPCFINLPLIPTHKWYPFRMKVCFPSPMLLMLVVIEHLRLTVPTHQNCLQSLHSCYGLGNHP